MTLKKIETIATTLGACTVAPAALEWARRHPIIPWTVSDGAALDACCRFADDHRVLVEPACGAALAPVYARAEPLRNAASLLIIVCGGAGVTLERLQEWKTMVQRYKALRRHPDARAPLQTMFRNET